MSDVIADGVPQPLSVAGLRQALLTGRLTSADIIDRFGTRAQRVGNATRCWATPDIGVPAIAPAFDVSRPLAGVPFAHKDVFADGTRSPRAGSQFDDLCVDAEPAPVLTTLREAGALGFGALATDELSYGATGLHAAGGPVRNPWNTTMIAGGSSSGAAAAVAARAVIFALGADTGGSVRIPAALCGVVGLKPTFASIDARGMVPLSRSQDTVGLMTRLAEDCARVLPVIQRPLAIDGNHSAQHNAATLDFIAALIDARAAQENAPGQSPLDNARPLHGVRIAVAQHPFLELHDTGLSARTAAALQVFETLGATLHPLPLRELEHYDAHATALTSFEAHMLHRERLQLTPQRLSEATRLRLTSAGQMEPAVYARAISARVPALERFVAHVFTEYDLLVCPAVTVRAQPIATLFHQPKAAVALTTALLRSNRCFNYLGVPALSLPIGFDDAGMPVGLQLIGRPWSEFSLLRYGIAYQRITGWHLAEPGLTAR